jgi:hypothetical protein
VKVTQEIVKVVNVLFGVNVEISVISAVPGFYKVVPSIYEDNISGDDDLVAVSNADGYGFPLGSQVEGPCGNVGTAWRCAGGRGYKL